MVELTIRVDEEHFEELMQLARRFVAAVDKLEDFVEEEDVQETGTEL
jgi:predicted transcriptional regulator